MEREALKQALEAYLCREMPEGTVISDPKWWASKIADAITKKALAQPAQEPFGWYSAQEDEFMTHKIRKEHERLGSYTHINGKFDLPLYTTPPQREWVGLTDEEIAQGNKESWVTKQAWESAVWWASEKLKEKNNGT